MGRAYAMNDGGSIQVAARPLRVGIMGNRPPLSYTGHNGELRGLAVDLARLLNRSMGRETSFVEGNIPELKAQLEKGNLDYISCIPMTDLAEPELQYIPTSFSLNRRILVVNKDTHITSEQDFLGRALILVQGDAQYQPAAEKAGARVIMAENTPVAIQLLSEGVADAFVSSLGEVASSMVQMLHEPNIALMGPSLARSPVCLVVDRRHDTLGVQLAGVLTNLEHAGTLEELREKWLGRPLAEEPTFWVRYRRIIVSSVFAGVALLLTVLAWSVLLRRKVASVTRDLRDSEQRYRELTEASPDVVLLLDADGVIRFANHSARALFGGNTSAIRPDALRAALDEQGNLELDTMLTEAGAGRVARGELAARPGGDRSVPLEIIAFRTAAEAEPLVCCMGRDLSVRRTMERELMRVERLAVIGRMAAGVAHEINNPLGIILSNTEYMQKKGAGPQQLEAVRRNVERAAGITRRLLHLAVPAGMVAAPVDLEDITRECLAFLKPRLREVDVDLVLPALPLCGDKGLLEQLVLNLLINALDGMRDRGHLRITGRMDGERGLQLAVQDSGPGIPRSELERIFDPFYSTKGAQGFGLGLFVARSIAERHGGLLFAESEPGRGALMILELPLQNSPQGN